MKRFFNTFYKTTGLVTDPGQRSIASRVTALTLQGAIAFSLLGTLGVNLTPLLTAAGVTGATLGFACKDFGANFVASIALSGQPCLRSGCKVTIGTGAAAVSGTVEDWDTRYLYLRNNKNHILSVPNNLILTSVVLWENPKQGVSPSANVPVDEPPSDGKQYPLASKEWKAHASGAEPPTPPTAPAPPSSGKK